MRSAAPAGTPGRRARRLRATDIPACDTTGANKKDKQMIEALKKTAHAVNDGNMGRLTYILLSFMLPAFPVAASLALSGAGIWDGPVFDPKPGITAMTVPRHLPTGTAGLVIFWSVVTLTSLGQIFAGMARMRSAGIPQPLIILMSCAPPFYCIGNVALCVWPPKSGDTGRGAEPGQAGEA